MKDLTILIPCLNEAETSGICKERAEKLLVDNYFNGELLVSDNGSTDGRQKIASTLGARVADCLIRNYGATL